jgi:uncharacterized membrane protein
MTAPDAETPESTPSPPTRITLRRLGFADPLHWLALGWRDFKRCPGIGLFYGGCFTVMGWVLLRVYQAAPAYVLALCAGFLLMGPFVCLGLYRASQRLERGEKPELGDSLLAWEKSAGTLAIFGFLLLVLEMLWGRVTVVIFAVSFDAVPDLRSSMLALADPANFRLTAVWLGVGALFAAVIFSISVVSMPMILDCQTDAITAGLTSLRLVLSQPLVMLFWGVLISAVVLLAMLPAFVGLLVAGPVLGHASWHAYRAAVAAPA